jgi:beta-phosphoglucomutase-like phosphatase (HAD superfamily)
VPLALVTASPRSVAQTVLAAVGADRFAVTVAEEDTDLTKPHPDPYLAAMARLGVTADCCVAIEDSPTGVASAQSAGCRVVAVPSITSIPSAPARLVLDSLEQVDPALLLEFIAIVQPAERAG